MRIFSFGRPRISSLGEPLSRDKLLSLGRIAVLDDETPEILQDLKKNGFAVDHYKSAEDAGQAFEQQRYDVLLLDYGGIGNTYGPDEGLDVLKHVKRVNPSLRVIAFSGRTFDASKADFFVLCDNRVTKDAGIRELTEIIEGELAESLNAARLWSLLCGELGIEPGSWKARRLEKGLVRSRVEGKLIGFARTAVAESKIAESVAGKLLEVIVRMALL